MSPAADQAAAAAAAAAVDPYLPHTGNHGYRVSHYDLVLDYRVATNRLSGVATVTLVAAPAGNGHTGSHKEGLDRFCLDLADTLAVTGVTVDGTRARRFAVRDGKLRITPAQPLTAGVTTTVVIRYHGKPRPVRSLWGDVGFEELTDGALVAGQPDGARSWFPCDDRADAKATARLQITTEAPYTVVACGEKVSRRVRSGTATWVFSLAEPTSTYLLTLQIGRYDVERLAGTPVPIRAAVPHRLRHRFAHDFARQPAMMELFVDRFGPYPLASGYTVVVADDDLEIPLESQGLSVFGANHCDGRRGAERLIAHELAHQWFGNSVTAHRWRDIWLHEGFACYAEWLWSEHSGGPSATEWAGRHHRRLADAPQDLLLADPGAAAMFDDRVYKRGALTLHAVRGALGDDAFFTVLRTWTARHRHATASTADFVGLVAEHAQAPLDALWDAWLFSAALPARARVTGT